MSYCKQLGKDRIIFATKEDHSTPSTVELAESGEEGRGLIMANGDINWNCPCLGGMASGPCGYQFREAFSCFHYSSSESKGSDCIEKFTEMTECMKQFPNLYPKDRDEDTQPESLMDITDDQSGQQLTDKAVERLSAQTDDKPLSDAKTVSDQQKT